MQTAMVQDRARSWISSYPCELPHRDTLIITCAHNEAKSLPHLLQSIKGYNLLLIDDGSTDSTHDFAVSHNILILRHQTRLGKVASLTDAISYAKGHNYRVVVEIDADSIPAPGAIDHMMRTLSRNRVGAVSAKQVPVGSKNMAYHVDELMWSVMHHAKVLQMSMRGYSHLGGVMTAFKLECVGAILGSVNDDEMLGHSILRKGFRTVYDDKAVVYFDASTDASHVIERRRRMVVGHMNFRRSTAPSMDVRIVSVALLKSLLEHPRRVAWAIPALALELYARVAAWFDFRNPKKMEEYARWVTKHAKNNITSQHSLPMA